MNAYKTAEKRWKKLTEQQLREDAALLDMRALSDEQRARVTQIGTWKSSDDARERPIYGFEAFGELHEGFYVIPDAVDPATQLDIAYSCLTEYVEAPHVTNMHQQNEQVAQIWQKARASHPREPAKSPALGKLHWGASGYHYDWTARKYYPDNFSPVPQRLAELGASCAEACGMTLASEAVIVNFYKKNSTMGGHQDDVEYTMDHPVVSLSLGSQCVFLKGGLTKDEAPLEVLLRSGDIAILGGKSRLSFHGVAKILASPMEIDEDDWKKLIDKHTARDAEEAETEQPGDAEKTEETKTVDWEDEFRAVKQYLDTHRININIRQVYGKETEAVEEEEEAQTKRQRTQ
ncbi:hypothetical protein Poli38472_008919 [Pythium oligandrum]|uniref:Alpha-ketoglutarate-dependent dioxygenase AlkB-like domain-containing protein n=1 Tax=Pythium oligandrum TaxID=41045 RepID=A0A8K1C4B3_PYTOL|nr:hypothetical protein Poli38472_008919 [Pythium oligandrum]|eukprot:TMW56271.1 hypothetical protein Poli38472_008919 [Pythium oligandrum]